MQTSHSSFPAHVQKRGLDLYTHMDAVLLSALHDLATTEGEGKGDRTSALYTAVMAAAPAMCFISKLIAECDEDNPRVTAHGKELPLVAGLILGRIVQLEEDGIKIDFTGRNILAAVEAASKVAGYDVKPVITQKMIQSYTEGMVRDGKTDLAYWAYVPEVTPSFDEFSEQLTKYINHSHAKH